jgi:hypothetical protein
MGLFQWLAPGAVRVVRVRPFDVAGLRPLLRVYRGVTSFFGFQCAAYRQTERQA